MSGFGEGFIPRRDIREYAIDEDLDFAELFWKVRAMDKAYLAFKRDEAKSEKGLEDAKREQEQRVSARRARR